MDESKNSLNKNLALCQIHRSFEVHEVPYTQATMYNHLSLIDDNIVLWTLDGVWKGKSVYLQRLDIVKPWEHAHHWRSYQFQEISEKEISITLDYIYHNILPDNSINNYTSTEVIKMELTDDLPIIKEIKTIYQPIEGSHIFENSYLKTRAHSLVRYWLYKIETTGSLKELFAPDFAIVANQKRYTPDFEDEINDLLKVIYPSKLCLLDIHELNVKQLSSGKIEITASIISETDKSIIQHRWICINDSEKPFMQITQFEVGNKWQLTPEICQNESSTY